MNEGERESCSEGVDGERIKKKREGEKESINGEKTKEKEWVCKRAEERKREG